MNFDLSVEDVREPLPPFTRDTAIKKIRLAEDAWNLKNAEKIATAYSLDSRWRNRDVFLQGRDDIVTFLQGKWRKELDYRLIKELWSFSEYRIAVRYVYEWHDENGQWFRSHGNENWEFNDRGLMAQRHASINDVAIAESDRKFHWSLGRRPDDHPELSELGL
ncbi:DUF1348 family protein [Teredinibacter turnerae]|uniref:Response regulator receiver domain protein n=1 Tax=Teredinibacter turnerae (strain ATCC 39867 / T7901) TaxID=377629 RepID=C5BRE0_TERTT|nr:nuclear transport factor 2 family protein [Teredinibacter turnerae]ACR12861.1 response regulator receiver domain protein [Teredinibacter turnerae T7901]